MLAAPVLSNINLRAGKTSPPCTVTTLFKSVVPIVSSLRVCRKNDTSTKQGVFKKEKGGRKKLQRLYFLLTFCLLPQTHCARLQPPSGAGKAGKEKKSKSKAVSRSTRAGLQVRHSPLANLSSTQKQILICHRIYKCKIAVATRLLGDEGNATLPQPMTTL